MQSRLGGPQPRPSEPGPTGEDFFFLSPASKPVRPSPRPPQVTALQLPLLDAEAPRPPPAVGFLFPWRPRPELFYPGAPRWGVYPPLNRAGFGSGHKQLRDVCTCPLGETETQPREEGEPENELVARFSQACFCSVNNRRHSTGQLPCWAPRKPRGLESGSPTVST